MVPAPAPAGESDGELSDVKTAPASGPTMMRLYSQDDNPGLKV
jgi:hypothetical protein